MTLCTNANVPLISQPPRPALSHSNHRLVKIVIIEAKPSRSTGLRDWTHVHHILTYGRQSPARQVSTIPQMVTSVKCCLAVASRGWLMGRPFELLVPLPPSLCKKENAPCWLGFDPGLPSESFSNLLRINPTTPFQPDETTGASQQQQNSGRLVFTHQPTAPVRPFPSVPAM